MLLAPILHNEVKVKDQESVLYLVKKALREGGWSLA